MQNNVTVDVEKRFCSLWVIKRDDEVILHRDPRENFAIRFRLSFTHHGSRHETLDIFFLLGYVIPQNKNQCSGVK